MVGKGRWGWGLFSISLLQYSIDFYIELLYLKKSFWIPLYSKRVEGFTLLISIFVWVSNLGIEADLIVVSFFLLVLLKDVIST